MWRATWEFSTSRGGASTDTSWLTTPDFNLDGRPDVAYGFWGQCALMLNSATGLPQSSQPSETLTGGYGFGQATAYAGDVNGDGYGDVIAGAFSAGTAAVFLGDPTGANPVGQILGAGENDNFGQAVAGVGDVNGDGYADVAVSNQSVSFLYLGGPSGVSPIATPPTLEGMVVGAAGDVNADGYSDVVACDRFAQTATVYLGGQAGLGDAILLSAPPTSSSFAESCINVGDVNGDGYSDIAVTDGAAGAAYVFYGGPLGTQVAGYTELPGMGGGGFGIIASIAAAGDVNGDGYGDVVFDTYDVNVVLVFEGGPMGVSTTATTTLSINSASVAAAGDTDGDGYDDLAVSSEDPSTCDVFVYPGSPTGITTTTPARDWQLGTQAGCYAGVLAR